jgi:alpha-mannosidase
LVQISHKTGLIDRYCVNGQDYLQDEALSTVVFDDNADPWNMGSNHFGPEYGRFRLMTPEEAGQFLNSCDGIAPPVRIVENGDVRTVVEDLLVYNRSYLVQTYCASKFDSKIRIKQRIQWNEHDKIAKLEVPTMLYNAAYKGQGMFGTASLPQDGTEAVSQRWLGLFGDGHALTVINNGTYGSHLNENKMYISLLRSPGYSVHPIPNRDLIPDTKRYLDRMDQGVHLLQFELSGNETEERISNVEFESQIFQQKPYGLNAFPTGEGTLPSDFIELSDKEVILSAAVYDAENERTILRLWNSAEKEKSVNVKLHLYGTEIRISMRPCGLYTYQINKDGSLYEIDPVTKTV